MVANITKFFASVVKSVLRRRVDGVDLSRVGDEIDPDDRLEANDDGNYFTTCRGEHVAGET